jgi:hypothetical protein
VTRCGLRRFTALPRGLPGFPAERRYWHLTDA